MGNLLYSKAKKSLKSSIFENEARKFPVFLSNVRKISLPVNVSQLRNLTRKSLTIYKTDY